MVVQRKTAVLTLEQNINVIKKLENSTPACKIASEMGLGKTQIQSLRKAELVPHYKIMFQQNLKGAGISLEIKK